ncbi:MAG: DUF2188 domain-containing protein [Eubacteriales bacterium]|nr:DUF2188 domain-containing protein [Eubacteriales bacterium]
MEKSTYKQETLKGKMGFPYIDAYNVYPGEKGGWNVIRSGNIRASYHKIKKAEAVAIAQDLCDKEKAILLIFDKNKNTMNRPNIKLRR